MLSAGLINHLLTQQPHLLAQLRPLAGRSFALHLPLLRLNLVVMPDGLLAVSEAEPEATLTLPLAFFVARQTEPQAAARHVLVLGDPDLATPVGHVLGQLQWDAAGDLSRLTGPIIAHRLDRAARLLASIPVAFSTRMSRTLVEYLRDETRAVPARYEISCFCNEVDTVRDRLALLEKRLQRLEQA